MSEDMTLAERAFAEIMRRHVDHEGCCNFCGAYRWLWKGQDDPLTTGKSQGPHDPDCIVVAIANRAGQSKRVAICDRCVGSGEDNGGICPHCGGTGRWRGA